MKPLILSCGDASMEVNPKDFCNWALVRILYIMGRQRENAIKRKVEAKKLNDFDDFVFAIADEVRYRGINKENSQPAYDMAFCYWRGSGAMTLKTTYND